MNTIPVIAVHGVGVGDGEARKGFSKGLRDLVYKDDPALAENWTECVWEDLNEEIDKHVGDIVRKLVLTYRKPYEAADATWWRTGLKHFGSFVVNLGLLLGGVAATQAVDLASDFILYLDSDHGKRIRDRLRERIVALAEAKPDGIALVAHSLGSVIAYDVLAEAVCDQKPLPVSQLITFGSPLAWTFDLRVADDKREQSFTSIGDTKWSNFFYKEDYVSLKAELPKDRFKEVENRQLPLPKGVDPMASHTAYWKDETFAAEVRKLTTR